MAGPSAGTGGAAAAAPDPADRRRAVGWLLFNAFAWGVSWWPLRWLEARGLHPLWATALVYLLAVGVLTLWRPGAWGELRRTPALWGLVLAAGTTNACFNWGVTIGDVVRVVLLFYLMPLWAVVLARLLLGERLTPLAALRVVLALAGASVVLQPEGGGWPLPRTLAEWLGVLGGFSFALNNVLLRRQAGSGSAARALAMFGGGALVAGTLALALGAFGASGVAGGVPWPPPPQAAWIAGMALLAGWFLLSNLALQYGAARLSASATAVVMVAEVPFAAGSALLLGAGSFSPALALGALLIVAAALLAAWR
jgi:drug/metabolite transporter (DMT)-like permease